MMYKKLSLFLTVFFAIIGFTLGFFVNDLIANTNNVINDPNKAAYLQDILNREKRLCNSYESGLKNIRKEIESYKKNKPITHLQSQYDKSRELAGLTEVKGKGIIINIIDKNASIKLDASNLLEYLNILRFAGAKAISVNNQRIISTTGIYQAGSNMLINKVPISTNGMFNYTIMAIGDPDKLYSYSITTNGLYDYLNSLKMQVIIKKSDNLVIPSYNGSITIKYAKSVK